MSATVTGTGLPVAGWKKNPLNANATTTTAAATTAATNASVGRAAGRRMGKRKPNVGCALGAPVTRANALSTSKGASGTASSVATERASSEASLNRAWHSAQPSRCAASAPTFASGSSTIRRSVPSVRCATAYLLAQRCLRAPQQSSYLSDADAERLRDLGVAESARAKDEHGCGFGRQSSESVAQPAAVLRDLGLLLGVEGLVLRLQRLRELALLPAPGASQAVERRVSSRTMQPRGRVLRSRRMQPVEVDEDLLRHVLGLMRIGEDAVGDPDDAGVFGREEGFEGLLVREALRDRGHPARTQIQAHHS